MRLSVITINYNNVEGFKRTAESVLSQVWKDFEWIIIDGGSTDGFTEYIQELSCTSKHLTYWCSEPDKGVYNAINKGISHCSGEYVSCMNSGDTFFDDHTIQRIFSTEHHADVLYGDWLQVYSDHSSMQRFPSPFGIHDFWAHNICHQAMFVKTSVLRTDGFDESFRLLADYKRWIELVLRGAEFEYLGVPVCRYNMNGISTNASQLLCEEQKRARQAFPPAVVNTVQHLWHYENFHQVQRMEALLEKRGIVAFVTKIVLKVLTRLFL